MVASFGGFVIQTRSKPVCQTAGTVERAATTLGGPRPRAATLSTAGKFRNEPTCWKAIIISFACLSEGRTAGRAHVNTKTTCELCEDGTESARSQPQPHKGRTWKGGTRKDPLLSLI